MISGTPPLAATWAYDGVLIIPASRIGAVVERGKRLDDLDQIRRKA